MDDATDRASVRRQPRLKVFQPAQLRVGEASTRVHVLDVSALGALMHGRVDLDPGRQVTLVCCGWTRGASIAWAAGGRFGLRFKEPLTTAQIAAAMSPTEREGRASGS
jgi:hypothetical protein